MSDTLYVTWDKAKPATAKKHGVAHGFGGSTVTRYFGPDSTVTDINTEGYRVEVEPRVAHRAHFHHVDQFQILFGASDTVHQGEIAGPLVIHYTDADTMYGPFNAGEHPYHYFTMRKLPSNFTGFIPEDRDELHLGEKKRHYKIGLGEWLTQELPAAGEVSVESVLPDSTDGLAGFTIVAGAGASLQTPSSAGSGGQYHLVIEGSAREGERELPQYAMGYVAPDAPAPTLVAGPSGLRLAVVQFGRDRVPASA